ncbi:hypothetical protein HNR65_003573 [Desulfosalsimonas propionicica]|uniref:Uncharacterized protein n=1 Tax=Desulfosalsimonas propionicica TaxID=332175 RepID=A0A7W0CCH1_9BACT|nr:hypothetical protein [Desulfosalsimonas propionicica]MBA2883211.1 hypothetical protein [Desulfosalsimonas propionicica]
MLLSQSLLSPAICYLVNPDFEKTVEKGFQAVKLPIRNPAGGLWLAGHCLNECWNAPLERFLERKSCSPPVLPIGDYLSAFMSAFSLFPVLTGKGLKVFPALAGDSLDSNFLYFAVGRIHLFRQGVDVFLLVGHQFFKGIDFGLKHILFSLEFFFQQLLILFGLIFKPLCCFGNRPVHLFFLVPPGIGQLSAAVHPCVFPVPQPRLHAPESLFHAPRCLCQTSPAAFIKYKNIKGVPHV